LEKFFHMLSKKQVEELSSAKNQEALIKTKMNKEILVILNGVDGSNVRQMLTALKFLISFAANNKS